MGHESVGKWFAVVRRSHGRTFCTYPTCLVVALNNIFCLPSIHYTLFQSLCGSF
jgi:hypothetical protein